MIHIDRFSIKQIDFWVFVYHISFFFSRLFACECDDDVARSLDVYMTVFHSAFISLPLSLKRNINNKKNWMNGYDLEQDVQQIRWGYVCRCVCVCTYEFWTKQNDWANLIIK